MTVCYSCGKECDEEAIYLRLGAIEVDAKIFFFCGKNCLLKFCIYSLDDSATETEKEEKAR